MADNFQSTASKELYLPSSSRSLLVKWKVTANQKVSKGSILAVYKNICPDVSNDKDIIVLPKFKSETGGRVKRLLVAEGEEVKPGQPVILLDVCEHKTIMKDMCAECGADLRREPGIPGNLKEPVSASVALVHNIPELRVSQEEAEVLGKKDKEVLLKNKKLVLLVDLDQTLIHTTTENVPPDMKDVYHFQLYGQACWYHTKFRPGWKTFLEDMSKYYELHIFTMGSRMYAHTIARMLDPTGELFADRIRSRDESFDMYSKYRDLSVLFPCDDSMVCIIDDREDIWDCAPNLVTVKPYRFFTGTGDINAPPGSNQAFTHPSAIPIHENAVDVHVETKGIEVTLNTGQNTTNDVPLNHEKQNDAVNGNKDPSSKMVALTSVSKDSEKIAISEDCKEDSTVVTLEQLKCSSSGKASESVTMDISDSFTLDEDKSKISQLCETMKSSDNAKEEPKVETLDKIDKSLSAQQSDTSSALVDGFAAKNDKVDEENNERGSIKEQSELGANQEKERDVTPPEDKKEVLYDRSKSSDIQETERHDGDFDDYLLYLEEILRRIHERFYEITACIKKPNGGSIQEGVGLLPDLRIIMPMLRQTVLKGTNIVFTGVIPTNCQHEESAVWRTASRFGANVTKDLLTRKNTADRSKRTTHVVAARPGTEKACQASRLPNVKLVNPNWLWTCAERWEFVDERLFPVEDYEKYKSRRHETPPVSRPTTEDLEDVGSLNIHIENSERRERSWSEASSESFKEALNPFLSFSSGEMEAMDKEVEDLMRSSDGEDGDDGDNRGDQEVLGSISSSSSDNDDGTNRTSRCEWDRGAKILGVPKGKTVNFSTIKQTLHQVEVPETMSKIRKLDFCDEDELPACKRLKTDKDTDEEGTEGEFSGNDGSSSDSESSDDDDDDDGNDMAARLEAAIYS